MKNVKDYSLFYRKHKNEFSVNVEIFARYILVSYVTWVYKDLGITTLKTVKSESKGTINSFYLMKLQVSKNFKGYSICIGIYLFLSPIRFIN